MAWSNEQVCEIIRHLGPVATLWLLAIIEKDIGTNKAHNYTVFPGKVQSLAKQYGRDPPEGDEISAAFDTLNRTPISTPDGQKDEIIQGDKQEYVKLTNHGLTLVKLIESRPEIQRFVDEYLGGEPDEATDWFPAPSPDGAPVQFRTVSEPPEEGAERYEAEARAEFQCPYSGCDGEAGVTFQFTYPDDMWSKKVQTHCPGCDQDWEIIVGDAFTEPTKPRS